MGTYKQNMFVIITQFNIKRAILSRGIIEHFNMFIV